MIKSLVAAALMLLVLSEGNSYAGLIVDGGFETTVAAPGTSILFTPGSTFGGPGGWLVLGDPLLGSQIGVLRTEASEPLNGVTAFNANSGFNSIDLTGVFNRGPSLGIQQSVTTVVGLDYTLSFFVGTVTPTFGPTAQSFYHDPATVDLSINGGARLHFTNANRTNGFVNWQQFSTTFTATTAVTTIAFLNGTMPINGDPNFTGTGLNGSNFTGIDDVLLEVAAVPEPTSLSLCMLGAIGWIFRFRRSSVARSCDHRHH